MDFNKDGFTLSSDREWLSYNGKFVARFRYGKSSACFKQFLIKNFTEEEYCSRLKAGEAPTEILMSKGYVSKFLKDRLILSGFEPTVAGLNAMTQYLRGAL